MCVKKLKLKKQRKPRSSSDSLTSRQHITASAAFASMAWRSNAAVLFAHVVLCLISSLAGSPSIIGYDCSHDMAEVTRLSTLDVEECLIDENSGDIKEVPVQLLQRKSFSSVSVSQCKVEVSRTISKCGWVSDSVVKKGFAEYIKEITRDECDIMIKHGHLKIHETIITNLGRNQTNSRSVVVAGAVGYDGGCEGSSFSDVDGSWDGVIVQMSLRITLKKFDTQLALPGKLVMLPSGYSCEFSEGSCIDIEDGHTFWEDSRIECEDNYDLLYEGPANRSVLISNGFSSIMFAAEKGMAFSFSVSSTSKVCGQDAHQLDHPKLVMVEGNIQKGRFFKSNNAKNLDMFTYMNSKFAYIEMHMKNQLLSLHKAVMMSQCESERSSLMTKLSIAQYSPSEFAFLHMKKPGFTAVLAGEVIYLVQCKSVPVERLMTAKCFQEFPVKYMNETKYMSPRNHLLQSRGTEIPCSEAMPTTHLVHGKWFSFTPQAHETVPPEMLKHSAIQNWKYSSTSSIISSGIYSQEDLDSIKEQIMFPLNKGTVINRLTLAATGSRGYDFSDDMDGIAKSMNIESHVHKALWKVSGMFSLVGNSVSAVIGFMVMFKLIKFVFDSGLHAYALYKSEGEVSWRMTAMFWDSLTTHMLTRRTAVPQADPVEPSAPSESHWRVKFHNEVLNYTAYVCVPDLSLTKFFRDEIIEPDGTRIKFTGESVTDMVKCACSGDMRKHIIESTLPFKH